MAILVIPIILAVLGLLSAVSIQSLKRYRVGVACWSTYYVVLAVAVGLGTWFGFFFHYQPSPRHVFFGFPIPHAFHVLEQYNDGTEQWVDFITPAPILFAASNILLFAFISTCVFWMFFRIQRVIFHRPKQSSRKEFEIADDSEVQEN